jgi:hypothetical protein
MFIENYRSLVGRDALVGMARWNFRLYIKFIFIYVSVVTSIVHILSDEIYQ